MMVCDRFEENVVSPAQSAPVLKACAILKRLSGGLHTVLVKASDGFLYVVKMMDSFQGPNVLANEALGNELAKYLGISVPAWRPIEISESCVDKYLLLHWTGSDSWLDRPGPGLYFGSRAVSQEEDAFVYHELPENWEGRISNRSDFAGMLLLDLWANQIGPRKAVFLPSADGLMVTAFFIGNGQMFGGYWGREEQQRGSALYPDRRVYTHLDVNRIFNTWLQKAIAMDEKMLLQMARIVPRQWHDSTYLQEVASQLQVRKWRVAQLLAQEMNLVSGVKTKITSSTGMADEGRGAVSQAGGLGTARKEASRQADSGGSDSANGESSQNGEAASN
jgi:hypothetical protein